MKVVDIAEEGAEEFERVCEAERPAAKAGAEEGIREGVVE